MNLRKSDVFLRGVAAATIVLGLLFLHAWSAVHDGSAQLAERRALVQKYDLTDLCLLTDARYTRHPAMADLATPFQDHPVSLEHFPSGTLVGPREKRRHGLD
jgi:hypothetical protein